MNIDTPETDAIQRTWENIGIPNSPIPANFARNLEVQRNEARKEAEKFRAMYYGPPPYSKHSKLKWEK